MNGPCKQLDKILSTTLHSNVIHHTQGMCKNGLPQMKKVKSKPNDVKKET